MGDEVTKLETLESSIEGGKKIPEEKIVKFDSEGNGSVFASCDGGPWGITVQIPEPASAILMIVGAGILRLSHRKR